jgi:serine/threonine-protein kinase
MVTTNADGSFGKAIVLDFGFAKERARASARRPGAPPDGGTPNYMAPERIRSGGASQEDDLYALGLTLWEMWTCRVPDPGYKPRAKPMRQQIMFDVPAGLSIDEIKQDFRCLSEEATSRIPARHLRFFNQAILTTNPTQVPRERLDPGPPPGRNATTAFQVGTQSLLATFATNATEFVGELIPLDKPELTIGRRNDVNIVVPEATVSGLHATLKWANGTWSIEDAGSTNGTYVEHTYERKKQANLMHGGEVQFGELRLKLVSFARDSAGHKRAKIYLGRRDGLTGLLSRDMMLKAIEDEAAFADWVEQPLSIARYELRGPNRTVSDRPTILEMLAFRRAATRAVELTDMLMLSLIAVTAGRTGPLRFAVAMMGPAPQDAKNLVEQVVGQVQGMLPEGLDLVASIARHEPGVPIRSLLDPA